MNTQKPINTVSARTILSVDTHHFGAPKTPILALEIPHIDPSQHIPENESGHYSRALTARLVAQICEKVADSYDARGPFEAAHIDTHNTDGIRSIEIRHNPGMSAMDLKDAAFAAIDRFFEDTTENSTVETYTHMLHQHSFIYNPARP